MVSVYQYQSLRYVYLIPDVAICTIPDGKVIILKEPYLQEQFVDLITWKELFTILIATLEGISDSLEKTIVVRFLHAYCINNKYTIPPLESYKHLTFPVYRHCCYTWSDGEEHEEDDHNSYYDFDYIWMEKEPFQYVLTLPSGIVLSMNEDTTDDKKIRDATWEEIQPLLDKEIRYRNNTSYLIKKLLLFGLPS